MSIRLHTGAMLFAQRHRIDIQNDMNRRGFLLGGGVTAIAAGGVAAGSFARMGSAAEYNEAMARLRARLAGNDWKEIIRFATLAANSHNTQAWRFRISEKSVAILPDFLRRTPVVDPEDHHLYVSLGCAAENLSLAAEAAGKPGELRFDPANNGAVIFDFSDGASSRSPLFDAIPLRQSSRSIYSGEPVSSLTLAQLGRAAKIPGVDVAIITDRATINGVRDLVIAGNSTQMADRAFVNELKHWLRFNPRDALATGDGLYSAASGNPPLPTWLGSTMFDLFFSANAENEKYANQLGSSAGVAVFFAEQNNPANWIRVGQACQRFALQATALGLKQAFINQPVEVSSLRADLASLAGLPGRRPNIVMRFGYGPFLPMSPRRPVEAVIDT